MAQNLLQLLLQPTGRPFGGLQNFFQGVGRSNTGVPFGGFLGLPNKQSGGQQLSLGTSGGFSTPDFTGGARQGDTRYLNDGTLQIFNNGRWQNSLAESQILTPRSQRPGFNLSTAATADAQDVLGRNINDPRVLDIAKGQVGSVGNREGINTATNTEALQFLAESRARLEELFGNRTSEIERLISSAPFTNELVESRKQSGFNSIQEQLEPLLQQTQVNFASRGLGRSSMAQNAGGGLRGQAISGRANLVNDLLNQQLETNTEAERFKQGLLSQVETQRAGFENRLGGIEAGIKAGNIIDPEAISRILGDVLSADIGIEDMLKYFDLANRNLTQDQNTAPLNALAQSFGILYPNAPAFQFGLQGLAQLLNSLFYPTSPI